MSTIANTATTATANSAKSPTSLPVEADWDDFLHHVKHEITDLADELLLALSTQPGIEIDQDLASLMRSMDELLRLYRNRSDVDRVEFDRTLGAVDD
ncbi:hypothetical protein [Sphaerotilus mobilis]|uniref:Uncharacterized protein n=1 Tax=Sphaerotilus mobilis TaxID=47994 RepID=A0A4Q7LAA1_9BURK|nr:hypothetical protein [Sphaerotilus mobilis]RZS47429.1 hypothetical protein EV685_3633 [Sphaerotilus mobilis]